jgi:hypothetical protein
MGKTISSRQRNCVTDASSWVGDSASEVVYSVVTENKKVTSSGGK